MDTKHILEQVRDGAVSVEEAEHYFRRAPFEELGYASSTPTGGCGPALPRSFLQRQG